MRRDDFVNAARSMVGARWRHRGRKPNAVDCVGLVVLAFTRAGGRVRDASHYGREPWEDLLRKSLRSQFGSPIHANELQPGDIALFRWYKSDPSHIGVIGQHPDHADVLTMIHADNLRGVVENSLVGKFKDALVEGYRPRFEE